MSLSRNTVADRTRDLATNLYDQLMEKGKDFVAFSLAVDESCDLILLSCQSSSVEWTQICVLRRSYWDSNQCMAQPQERKSLRRFPNV